MRVLPAPCLERHPGVRELPINHLSAADVALFFRVDLETVAHVHEKRDGCTNVSINSLPPPVDLLEELHKSQDEQRGADERQGEAYQRRNDSAHGKDGDDEAASEGVADGFHRLLSDCLFRARGPIADAVLKARAAFGGRF